MSHQPTIPMVLMQPQPASIVEEFYKEGEPVLPKAEGEFTFFLMQPIYTKNSTAFTRPVAGPDVWDTHHFKPGAPAPGPCVVLWSKVVRKSSIVTNKPPGLITPK